MRRQFSVFFCRLSASDLVRLKGRLYDVMDLGPRSGPLYPPVCPLFWVNRVAGPSGPDARLGKRGEVGAPTDVGAGTPGRICQKAQPIGGGNPPPPPADVKTKPRRPVAKPSPRGLIAAGTIGLLSRVSWFIFSSRGYDPKHRHPEMPDYAARFLMTKLEKEDNLHDSKDYEPLAKAQKDSRELYEDMAATMPPSREYEMLLSEAASFFDGDVFDVWTNCRRASKELCQGGTKPTDFLQGLVQTMRSAGRRGCEKRSIRRFVVMYESLTQDGMSHNDAIADLTRRMRDYGSF